MRGRMNVSTCMSTTSAARVSCTASTDTRSRSASVRSSAMASRPAVTACAASPAAERASELAARGRRQETQGRTVAGWLPLACSSAAAAGTSSVKARVSLAVRSGLGLARAMRRADDCAAQGGAPQERRSVRSLSRLSAGADRRRDGGAGTTLAPRAPRHSFHKEVANARPATRAASLYDPRAPDERMGEGRRKVRPGLVPGRRRCRGRRAVSMRQPAKPRAVRGLRRPLRQHVAEGGLPDGDRAAHDPLRGSTTTTSTSTTTSTTTLPPGVTYGNAGEFPAASWNSPGYLLGGPLTVSQTSTLTHLGLVAKAAGPHVIVALYSDTAGEPDRLVASTPATTLTVGPVQVPVTRTPLPAGTYWIMAMYDGDASVGIDESDPDAPVRDMAQSFSDPLPDPMPPAFSYSGQRFNYYVRGAEYRALRA